MSYRRYDWSESAKITDLITSTCGCCEVDKTTKMKLQENDME